MSALEVCICVRSVLWDLMDQTPKTEFIGHKSDVSSFAFSPDYRLFVTGGGDCIPRLWDLRLGQTVRLFTDLESPKQDINDVAVSDSALGFQSYQMPPNLKNNSIWFLVKLLVRARCRFMNLTNNSVRNVVCG